MARDTETERETQTERDTDRERDTATTMEWFMTLLHMCFRLFKFLLHMCFRLFKFSSPSSAAAAPAAAASAADDVGAAAADDVGADNPPLRGKYDVFISFRGEDTRFNITSHLHAALLQRKIETYIDYNLQRGEEIGPALLEAIEKSTLSVIIFSQNYASSTWCLEELVHILKCKKKSGQIVIPIFYDINPSDVRHQRGSYARAFAQHKKRFYDSIDKVQEWRDALTTAAKLSGFDYSEKSRTEAEADLIKKVVDHIWTRLKCESSCNLEGFIGIESRIEQIESLLDIHSQDACITVGIWGMGGIGKTTLAETVFNRLSSKFEACCFLRNVRENLEQPNGLDHLEKTLLKGILKEECLSIGSTFVRERLIRTKVLIVLDDVSDSMQMGRLAANRLQFGIGSRIIITSRDRRTFRQTVEEDKIYRVEGLKPDDAFQLFRSHAFKNNNIPTIDFKELPKKVVDYAGGIPLAIITLGSLFVNCKSKAEWEDELNKLKQFPDENIQRVLRLSYDRLGKNDKEIFLDIACFHKGKHEGYVTKMLNIRGFCAAAGIRALIDASLITIDSAGVKMHDLIQEMGCTIVLEQCEDPRKRNRLFNDEDVYHVLESNRGTRHVQAILIKCWQIEKRPLKCADFKVMFNLKMLIVVTSEHFGNYSTLTTSLDLPNSLRYLYWYGYPWESLPSNFSPENLVELHMPYSRVKQLWKEDKRLVSLEVINLQYSSDLTEVPNLSGSPKIGHIYLHGCKSLLEIPSYFQHLDKLTYLDLGSCTSLISLTNICKVKSLKELILSGCSKLESFPEIVVPMGHLKYLNLKGTAVENLPSSIGNLIGLETLDLGMCKNLKVVPRSIYNLINLENLSFYACRKLKKLPSNSVGLPSLKKLDLSDSGLLGIPDGLVCTASLGYLEFSRSMIRSLPASIKQASRLHRLKLIGCKRLQSLPELPLGCSLEARDCTSLKTVSSSRITDYTQGLGGDCYCESLDRDFSNCRNLDHNARSNIMDYAQLVFNLAANEYLRDGPSIFTRDWPTYDIVCPGKEIPNWFSYQSEESSVNIELRQDWFRTGFLGFVLAVVVSCELNQLEWMEIRASFKAKFMGESHEIFTHDHSFTLDGSNLNYCYDRHHVYLWNEEFERAKVPDFCKHANEASVEFCLVDEHSGEPTSYMKVEKCGICPLYQEDVDYVIMRGVPEAKRVIVPGEEEEEEIRHDDFEAGEPKDVGSSDESEEEASGSGPEANACYEFEAT